MKTQKEKLIDILSVPIHPRIGADYTEVVADYLLDNDVLPVVRCKDCRFLDNVSLNHGIYYCWKHHKEVECDGYCSYGERKDDKD